MIGGTSTRDEIIKLNRSPPNLRIKQAYKNDHSIVLAFVMGGILFQLGLFTLGDTPLRIVFRTGLFAISLCLLILVKTRSLQFAHPAATLVPTVGCVLLISLLIPGAGLIAATSQIALYIAVLAPLLWVSRLRIDFRCFRHVVIALWLFYTSGATMGILQAEFPGRFDGAISNQIDQDFIDGHMVTLADGTRMLRPKGLTDEPGGAGVAGMYAAMLSLGLLVTEPTLKFKLFAIGTTCLGVSAIYLSQVRFTLVVLLIAAAVLAIVLAKRAAITKLGLLLGSGLGVGTAATLFAVSIGGIDTIERWSTLTSDDPTTVVYSTRGFFLDALIHQDIYTYPLGAGGGRWGMMNHYFGDPRQALWAEMMWQALLYDGGLPLIALYLMLLSMLVFTAWKIAISSKNDVTASWSAALLGMDIAIVAASFDFPILVKDIGLQMFLLNALFYAAVNLKAPAPIIMRNSNIRSKVPSARVRQLLSIR